MEMDNQSTKLRGEIIQEKSIKIQPPEEVQEVDLYNSDLEEDYCFGDIYLCLNETTNTVDEIHERNIVKKNYKNAESDSSFDINKFKFKCLICRKIFKNNSLLTTHMMTHIIMIQQEHAYCKQVYMNVITHTTMVQNKFPCMYCKKSFYYEHHLSKHTKIKHSSVRETSKKKELEVQCKVDDKPNSEEENRSSPCMKIDPIHESRNVNIEGDSDVNKDEVFKSKIDDGNSTKQPVYNVIKFWFKCTICKRVFSRNKGLKRHLKTHNRKRDKRFLCTHCSECFYSNYHLNRHIQAVHLKRTFKCEFCAYTATRNYRVTAHTLSIHKK